MITARAYSRPGPGTGGALFWSSLLEAPLIAGVLPTVVSAAGGIAMLCLLARRGKRWWLRTVPICLAIGVAVAGLSALGVAWLRPFPDLLPLRILLWIGFAAAGCALAVARVRVSSRRVLAASAAVVALLAVLATSGVKVNAFYGYRPSLAAVLGLPTGDETVFADLAPESPIIVSPPDVPVAATWKPPSDMPAKGKVSQVDIPGTVSGFPARPGWVYLPPAYLGSTRAELPVLVLIPGQPGGPEDWLRAGQLAKVLDRFAAAHHGLAPVVIVPDTTGSSLGNTMCLDSRLGNAETYLAVDVPAWEAKNLQVRKRDRAIGGFSYGGTCALQLAVRKPTVYPTFLDISGQAEPTLGDRGQTVAATFGGDEAAFLGVSPLEVLKAPRPDETDRYAASSGILAIGREDTVYRSDAERVMAAAAASGLPLRLAEMNGGHTWPMAIDSLTAALPWIAGRAGLIAPPR